MRLFLEGGKWKGKHIVSADWDLESRVKDAYNESESDRAIGYHENLWWGIIGGKTVNAWHVDVRSGRYIDIFPPDRGHIENHGLSEHP